MRAGQARLVIVADDFSGLDDVVIATTPLARATHQQIRELSDSVTPQGIVAVCDWRPSTLEELPAQPMLVAVCAQIRDPGNLGTVIRCADAFGADAVIVTHDSVDVTNPKTVRASVGSIFHLPIVTDVGFAKVIAWCAENSLRSCATQMAGTPLTQLDLNQPTAWIFGNEAWGLPAEQAAACQQSVSIPMWGQAESLNLSTAAAVCLFASASAQRGLGQAIH